MGPRWWPRVALHAPKKRSFSRLVVVLMIISVFRPRVHGQPVQNLKTMTVNLAKMTHCLDHMLLVLLREGAIVGPIPTMSTGIGNRAHHMVRDGRSTLMTTIPMMMLQPVAQDAQNFHPMCLVN